MILDTCKACDKLFTPTEDALLIDDELKFCSTLCCAQFIALSQWSPTKGRKPQ